jgi:hypothetical protein
MGSALSPPTSERRHGMADPIPGRRYLPPAVHSTLHSCSLRVRHRAGSRRYPAFSFPAHQVAKLVKHAKRCRSPSFLGQAIEPGSDIDPPPAPSSNSNVVPPGPCCSSIRSSRRRMHKVPTAVTICPASQVLLPNIAPPGITGHPVFIPGGQRAASAAADSAMQVIGRVKGDRARSLASGSGRPEHAVERKRG